MAKIKQQYTHLYDILPYQTIEDKVLILRDGRVSVLFEVQGIELDSWNALDFDSFVNKFEDTIKAMPDGLDIIKIDAYYKEHQFTSDEVQAIYDKSGFFVGKTAEMFSKYKGLKQKSYLVLTLNKPKDRKPIEYKTLYAKLALNRTLKSLSKNSSRIKQINQIADEFLQYFPSEIHLTRLEDTAINNLIYSFLNLDFSKSQKDYFSCGIDFSDPRFLNLGKKKVNILTLQKINETDNFGAKFYKNDVAIAQFATFPTSQFLDCEHITIQTIKKRKNVDRRFSLEKTATNMRISSPLIDNYMKKAEAITEELDALQKMNDDLVLYNHLVITWSHPDDEESYNSYNLSKKALSCLGKYNEESFDIANLFFSSLPGVNGDCFRDIVMPTSEASCLMSFTRNYDQDDEGYFYTDRIGNAITLDVLHPLMEAKNGLKVGGTGSGKSFDSGYSIATSYSEGDIQVIIDKGKTYKNVITALGGKYYEYDESDVASLSFNPFLLSRKEDGNYNLTADKIEFLTTLLEVLWKQTEKEIILSKEEKALLQDKIERFYVYTKDNNIHPSLESFVDFVSENSDSEEDKKFFDLMSFKLCMRPYITGIYKNLFSSTEITRLDEHKLICFEMDGIASNRSLFSIVTLLIIELVMDFLRQYPNLRKHLIIDEAWALFGGEMGEFMQYVYRTIRKMKGRGVVITQSALDLEKSPIGDVLVSNSHLLQILNQGNNPPTALARVFNLSDEEIGKISSMRKENDKLRIGREMFIKRVGVDEGKVVSLKVPLEVKPILTSDPEERNLFNDLIKQVESERKIHEKMEGLSQMEIIDLKRECVFEAINLWVKAMEAKN